MEIMEPIGERTCGAFRRSTWEGEVVGVGGV